jgi:hypothetical protein
VNRRGSSYSRHLDVRSRNGAALISTVALATKSTDRALKDNI